MLLASEIAYSSSQKTALDYLAIFGGVLLGVASIFKLPIKRSSATVIAIVYLPIASVALFYFAFFFTFHAFGRAP